jgi:two-component system chemotaxis sensor kinase CheA
MSIDLDQFHDAFFEESFEALETMEASLLKLNVGAPDAELIGTIFRVAHSIKGGAGMFGFNEVASFTHTLETMLDELRSGRLNVTIHICDLMLKSVDVMRGMLRAVQHKTPIDAQAVADLQFDLELVVAQKGAAATPPVAAPAPPAPPAVAAPAAVAAVPRADMPTPATAARGWRIGVTPLPSLLVHGNDPLRLFGDLAELGELRCTPRPVELPPLAALDPECCYLQWDLELRGDCDRAAVEGVFDWVVGDCEWQIDALGGEPGAATAQPAAGAAGEAAPVTRDPPAPTTPAAAPAPVAAASPVATPPSAAPAPATVAAAPAVQAVAKGADHGKAGAADASSIRVAIEKIDELMNAVGEVVITQSMLTQLSTRVHGETADRLRAGLAQLERNVRELQESVMRVRMLPISSVFSRFPRLTRDLSQRLGKNIELKMTGEGTELDKTVLERIGDPMVHLVRNCIDHGIEMPDVRAAAGKPEAGTVHLNAYHKGASIIIEVMDDGKGLDKARILEKARAKGLVGATDNLGDEALNDLIFLPGFSTADKTTDLSGRGVGMDVVRRNIKQLGGTVELRSEKGKGTCFTISLPLTLAIVDGQSVAVGTETYIVPLVTIVESLQLKAGSARELVKRGEVFPFRGDYLPIIRMHEIFDIEPNSRELHEGLIMVVEGDGRKVGLFVDDLLGQQQVVIKSMETNYGRIDGVSGATILGEGTVALILDIPGLIRVAADRLLERTAA